MADSFKTLDLNHDSESSLMLKRLEEKIFSRSDYWRVKV